MLRIIPLGGLGEIGLNMTVFEYGDAGLIVDAGLMFPEDQMPGVDCVIPDMAYFRQQGPFSPGVVLTHAHEDHIGALPYLLREMNPPIFGTPFTVAIVRHKLEAHGLAAVARLHEVRPGESLRFGAFRVEFIRVGHSVVDGVGLAIGTPEGMIVHTGDFKISPSATDGMATDVNRFAALGAGGVLALMSDSTNVEQEGYTLSDKQVGATLAKVADASRGRLIVALFASSIARIQQVVDIAAARNRKVAIHGRSIENSTGIASDLGYLQLPPGQLIDIDQVGGYPDERVAIITTGSQGEPMAALARMASGTHRHIRIREPDTVVLSSKCIPGNERAIGRIIDNLYRRGAEVIYEKISAIHVSGHAFREELKMMIRLTRPRFFIPVHGEYRHLVLHARLAEQVGIARENVILAENGQTIEFDAGGGRLGPRVSTGRIFVDGKGIGDVGRSVLKERRNLSEDGVVVVNMAFDEETGVIVYGPDVVSKGFVFETRTGHLLEDAKCVILEIVEELGPETPQRVDRIRAKVGTALRKYFEFAIRRRPVILPFIQEI